MSGFIIDTPEGIEHFGDCQLIARLRIEINTRLASRISTLKMVKHRYPECKAQTKVKALEFMEAKYLEKYGWEYGSKP